MSKENAHRLTEKQKSIDPQRKFLGESQPPTHNRDVKAAPKKDTQTTTSATGKRRS